ncbi:MAG: hypothetical protein ROD09_11770 [Candidatus Sedimenticola sp. (ex Thyasira tokunagai)]
MEPVPSPDPEWGSACVMVPAPGLTVIVSAVVKSDTSIDVYIITGLHNQTGTGAWYPP